MALLNPICLIALGLSISILTFHYGAIKPAIKEFSIRMLEALTFHYGAIKPRYEKETGRRPIILTFHYGAIKPMLSKRYC